MSAAAPGGAPGRMLRGPLLPLALLVAQLLAVYLLDGRVHGWKPARMPDSQSYVQAARATSFTQAVSHYRTYGYPLFLRLVAAGGTRVGHLPSLQFALYGLAVVLLWGALRSYVGSPWLAFAGATPLPWAYVVDLMPEVMTDPLAATLTVTVAAVALALAVRPANRPLWLALVLAVMAAYQVRPAAVFLVGWAPLAAVVLRLGREGRPGRGLWRWGAGLALVTLVPYLAFAGARRLAVGHFGLVSFGGTNLAGVAACFLDEELVAELPPEHRPLAATMLRIRRQRLGWEPMTAGADTRQWFFQYSDNIWRVAITAAETQLRKEERRLAASGAAPDDPRPRRVRRNEMLNGAARAILRARPRLYLQWVRDSLLYGLGSLAGRPWIVWPLALLGGSLLALVVRRGAAALPSVGDPDGRAVGAILVLALSYFVIYLGLLSLVSWPFPRYFSAMILLLPSALALALVDVWRRLLGAAPALPVAQSR